MTTLDILTGLLLQWGPHGPHWGPNGGMGMGSWGGTVFGFLWGLLVVVALIGGGAYLLLRIIREQKSDGDTALNLLRERYARGEIDEEEFEKRRRQLDREI